MFMSNSRLVYPLVSICGHLIKKQWYRTIYLQYFYLCPYLPAYLFIFICTHTHAYIDGQIDKCICEHRYCGKFRGPSSNITILRVVRSVQITMNETLKKQYPFSPMYALRNMAARHRARNLKQWALNKTFLPPSLALPLSLSANHRRYPLQYWLQCEYGSSLPHSLISYLLQWANYGSPQTAWLETASSKPTPTQCSVKTPLDAALL